MKKYNSDNFVEFLVNKKNIPEKQAKYFLLWVNKFLSYYQKDLKIVNYKIIKDFLDTLESESKEDWQLRQAYRAIKLLIEDYMGLSIDFDRDTETICSEMPVYNPKTWKEAFTKFINEIRFQHLSYSTEKTYRSWIRRFISFCNNTLPEQITSSHVKRFLVHLAVDRNVSASTQNQAFNALLFLFRHVLNKEKKGTYEI